MNLLDLRRLRARVVTCAESFDADAVETPEAAEGVEHWAAIEHAAAAAKAAAAARVAATSAWQASGAPTAADWLARATGTTAARARQQLETAKQLAELDATSAAARRGEMSPDQVAAIADAAAADPGVEQRLLDAAAHESVGELRQRCQRTKAAADPDPDGTARRLHAARSLKRYGTPDGMQHLHAMGPAEAMARIDAQLRPLIDERFQAARAAGEREPHQAYAFDALVALAEREGGSSPSKTARHRTLVRVDLEALIRGAVEGEETCEIAGLGPIPVSQARSLLGESTLYLVITKGVAVGNVTYLGRGPNAAQRIALLWQQPGCSALGCSRQARLQVDHRDPYARVRVTELHNLDRYCDHDHDLKTRFGWALVAGTGKRLFVPPDHPDHPRNARARAPARAP